LKALDVIEKWIFVSCILLQRAIGVAEL